jgi:ABC-type Fe3+ transport system substrate-binding protein
MALLKDVMRAGAITAVMVGSLAARPAWSADAGLIEAARKEGEVVWYTTLIVNQAVRPIVSAFEKKYPGIKLSFVPGPPPETATRLLNEARAGKVRADVFDGGATFHPIHAAQLVDRFVPQAAAHYPAEYKSPEGLWTATNVYILAAAVNTELVKRADMPRSYEDLLDSKWRGKMAWADTPSASGPAGFIGNILLTMGKERGLEYLRKLATQEIANVPAVQRVVLDQAIAGQYPLVLCVYNNHVQISAEQGAPVEWLKLEPLILTFGKVALLKNSPHPNAGKLLIEFLLSDEGQTVLREANYLTASASVPAKVPALMPQAGGYKVKVISPAMFVENEAEWMRLSKDLFH